ncbi:MAG TPA: ATP-grasp domain-containing protein [Candidatus Eisenbacteria bacterium]|nr:ATP-grasp domain-containing protein [Candidatus Eisenbacteria bacterium]
MNVLVTNTLNPQSYVIITALRPYAKKIVATMESSSRLAARSCQAANSRFVDRRYWLPSPVGDWREGRIGRENTEQEESFIRSIEAICEKEKIDVVFPSWDPYVYLFSKNKERFRENGVTIPVPCYDTALKALDKFQTVQAAVAAGFPCPRSYVYTAREELESLLSRETFPLVIKPRFGSGGRGLAIVRNRSELFATLPEIEKSHGKPMIQEYIPGRDRVSFPILLDRSGEVKFAFHKRIVRNFRVTARFGTVEESVRLDSELLNNAAKLLKWIGWWGSVSVGTLRDPRDNQYKLMEINPRFSRNMWHRAALGINEPLMCIKMAQGETIESANDYPVGALFVCPVEDFQLLLLQALDAIAYRFRTGVLRRAPLDPLSRPKTILSQLRCYIETYTGGRQKLFDPHFRYFFRDPLVSLLWWFRFSSWVVGALKHVGR